MGKKEPEAPPEPKPSEAEILYVLCPGDTWGGGYNMIGYQRERPIGYRTKEAALSGAYAGSVILTVRVLERARKRVHECAESF